MSMRGAGQRGMAGGVATVATVVLLAAVASAQTSDARRELDRAEALRLTDPASALAAHERVARRFPDDPVQALALLRVAEARWSAGDLDGARETIDELRRRHPRAPAAAGALVLQGRMQLASATDGDDLRAARAVLSEVPRQFPRDTYPEGVWRREAGLWRGRIDLMLGLTDRAGGEFLAAVEDEPSGPGALEAQLELALVFGRQTEVDEAAELLQRVADRAAEAPELAARARRTLTLLHRLVYRPRHGAPAWSRVRRRPGPGRGFEDPTGVAVSAEGRLVVSDEGTDLALTFDTAGTLVGTATAGRLRLPFWGADDQPYVVDRDGIQTGGGAPRLFEVRAGGDRRRLDNLRAGARDALGRWTLLDVGRRQVARFDATGRHVATIVDRSSDRRIVDLAMDTGGQVWLLDRERGQVIQVGADGVLTGPVVTRAWRRPEALAVDTLGHLYVLDRDARLVDVFRTDGRYLTSVGPVLPDGTSLRGPRDIAVDGEGRLYIADRDEGVVWVLE